jgi:neutral trehalase
MVETARTVVNNLLGLVEDYGFVPNGSRRYYLNRSQPPMLTLMVRAVYDVTVSGITALSQVACAAVTAACECRWAYLLTLSLPYAVHLRASLALRATTLGCVK